MPTATRRGATHPSEYPANNHTVNRVTIALRSGRAVGPGGRGEQKHTHTHTHTHRNADGRTEVTQALREYPASTIAYPTGTRTNADGRAGGWDSGPE